MPYDERDDETGRFSEEYPSGAFIEALEALSGAAGTQEVADEIGCAYRTAYARLSELEKAGEITSRKVGNARLWQLDSSETSTGD